MAPAYFSRLMARRRAARAEANPSVARSTSSESEQQLAQDLHDAALDSQQHADAQSYSPIGWWPVSDLSSFSEPSFNELYMDVNGHILPPSLLPTTSPIASDGSSHAPAADAPAADAAGADKPERVFAWCEQSHVINQASLELQRCTMLAAGWSATGFPDVTLAETTLRVLIQCQRELLLWADPKRRAAVTQWVEVDFPARAEALKWRLRQFLHPGCPKCLPTGCGDHNHALETAIARAAGQLTPFVLAEKLDETMRYWHEQATGPQLDLSAYLQTLAMIDAIAAWAQPVRTDAQALECVQLVRSSLPACEALGAHLHQVMHPQCTCRFEHGSTHRMAWACGAVRKIQLPPLLAEAPTAADMHDSSPAITLLRAGVAALAAHDASASGAEAMNTQ
jgi:hypothetical protein